MEDDIPPLTDTEFHEYIEFHASRITPREAHELMDHLAELRQEFAGVQALGFPQAPAQFVFLADLVEGFLTGRADTIPYHAAAEAMLALFYLRDGKDLIPDSLPDVGYMDDALIARLVMVRNSEAFRSHAMQTGVDWSTIEPADLQE